MPLYEIPPGGGPYVVVESRDGGFAVADERMMRADMKPQVAAKLGLIFIPCRDEQQADDVAATLNRGDHGGRVQVDLFGPVAGAAGAEGD